jgi:uncharacterized membrane protein YheB (UPF0754 family)
LKSKLSQIEETNTLLEKDVHQRVSQVKDKELQALVRETLKSSLRESLQVKPQTLKQRFDKLETIDSMLTEYTALNK